tara:strand:+ start:140 stop:259 length:120 start_codon:yes stop_codon:yes gene_type:complete
LLEVVLVDHLQLMVKVLGEVVLVDIGQALNLLSLALDLL